MIFFKPLGLFCYFPDFCLSVIPLILAQYQKAHMAPYVLKMRKGRM